MRVDIEIRGDKEVIGRLEAMPDKLRVALRKKMSFLTLYLENYIKSEKLSGQVLNVVTGRLRRSIFSRVVETQTSVEGEVSSSGDVKYAARHEFGFRGPEIVSAHTREIKQAFGRAIAPKIIEVREFTREANTPERSFMRSSLADLRNFLTKGLEDAVREGSS